MSSDNDFYNTLSFKSLKSKCDPFINAQRSFNDACIINGVQKCDDQTEKEHTDELYEYFSGDIINVECDASELTLSGLEVICAIQFIVVCGGTIDIENISLDSVLQAFFYCYITDNMQELFNNAAKDAKE